MKAIVPAWRAHSLSQNWFNSIDPLFAQLLSETTPREKNLPLSCDIEETEKYLLFSFDLPGIDEKDLFVEVKDSVLTIKGERKREITSENNKSYIGRYYGSFDHHFRIPKTVNVEKIEADYSQGVLTVLLPKIEQAQPQKIEIKTKKGNFLSQILKSKETE